MLKDLILSGYGDAEDFNCAEKILYGANVAYHLGLNQDACKMIAGFGGGMGVEKLCGAVAGSIAVLSLLFVEECGHKSPKIKPLTKEFLERYEQKMGSIDCAPLKKAHRQEESVKCLYVIAAAAEILDDIIAREKN